MVACICQTADELSECNHRSCRYWGCADKGEGANGRWSGPGWKVWVNDGEELLRVMAVGSQPSNDGRVRRTNDASNDCGRALSPVSDAALFALSPFSAVRLSLCGRLPRLAPRPRT